MREPETERIQREMTRYADDDEIIPLINRTSSMVMSTKTKGHVLRSWSEFANNLEAAGVGREGLDDIGAGKLISAAMSVRLAVEHLRSRTV